MTLDCYFNKLILYRIRNDSFIMLIPLPYILLLLHIGT